MAHLIEQQRVVDEIQPISHACQVPTPF